MKIGDITLESPVIAAPMAGITDKPYRRVCRSFGAGLVVSEMIGGKSDAPLSTKTKFRSDFDLEAAPIAVQLVGTNAVVMALSARENFEKGAAIIDINMGCPAKKVCSKAAGSALLANEKQVEAILTAVVRSVPIPVTLKVRTGINRKSKNVIRIAKIAEQAGNCKFGNTWANKGV